MNVLDLCSGIGGFSLGLQRAGMRTLAFCEIDPFCRAVLAKHWPGTVCFEDIRELTADRLDRIGPIDLVCAGYPCQPFSHAGKRAGKQDARNLWPEVRRIVASVRPSWFLGENVVGHVTVGLDEVLLDLEGLGYSARPFVIPAAAVDAWHIRQRVWIIGCALTDAHGKPLWVDQQRPARRRVEVCDGGEALAGDDGPTQSLADAHGSGREILGEPQYAGEPSTSGPESDGCGETGRRNRPIVADACGPGLEERPGPEIQRGTVWNEGNAAPASCRWLPEPPLGRVAPGLPGRVDRLRALGNSVVPQVVEVIGRAIMIEHAKLPSIKARPVNVDIARECCGVAGGE